MPPKRKPGIQGGNKFQTEADRKRWERANETPEQTRLRLDTQRQLQSARRDGESESETAARLLTQKQIKSSYRSLRLTRKLLGASIRRGNTNRLI